MLLMAFATVLFEKRGTWTIAHIALQNRVLAEPNTGATG